MNTTMEYKAYNGSVKFFERSLNVNTNAAGDRKGGHGGPPAEHPEHEFMIGKQTRVRVSRRKMLYRKRIRRNGTEPVPYGFLDR